MMIETAHLLPQHFNTLTSLISNLPQSPALPPKCNVRENLHVDKRIFFLWDFCSWYFDTHHWCRGRRTRAHGQHHNLQLFSCPSFSHLCPWLAAHIFFVKQWSPKLCKPGPEPRAGLISDKLSFRQEFPSVCRNRNPCRNYAFSSLIQGILKTMESAPS